MSSNKAFCARPGCLVAFAVHGQPGSCGNYIAPDSKAGRAVTQAEKTRPAGSPVDSRLLDRILMEGALAHLQGRIKTATTHLQRGLAYQALREEEKAGVQFRAALRALGTLGAS